MEDKHKKIHQFNKKKIQRKTKNMLKETSAPAIEDKPRKPVPVLKRRFFLVRILAIVLLVFIKVSRKVKKKRLAR